MKANSPFLNETIFCSHLCRRCRVSSPPVRHIDEPYPLIDERLRRGIRNDAAGDGGPANVLFPEVYRLQLVIDIELHLIGKMRTVGACGGGPERLDRA
jgi:hypothetical protein